MPERLGVAMIRTLFQKHRMFDSVAYAPLSIFANSLVEIYEPNAESAEWSPETGLVAAEQTPIWRGWAAVTPNMDWRSRDRRSAYDDTAVHSYRIQLWHIDKNLLVPKDEWGDKAKRVHLSYGQRVKVVKHESDPVREGLSLVVRNATTDSDWWQPTLLCDIDTGDMYGNTH